MFLNGKTMTEIIFVDQQIKAWEVNVKGHVLHGPSMLVDKTNYGLVLYNHANFYGFDELSSYWSVK